MKNHELAINGGPKAKKSPYGTGKRYLDKELEYLRDALEQNTLFYGYGKWVKRACAMMCEYSGMPYVVACSSGSAAVHLGLIAAGVGPGDEVIVTPNTDQGSVLGILEEGAVPVFTDPAMNLNPCAEDIEKRITEYTKAVVVVHLTGYAAPVDKIAELCTARGIGLVEDCAQSWGAKLNGKMVGSFGDAGCYSTNDYKHISTGDGGFVALRDESLYRRVSNYSDKHYDRLFDGSLRQKHHALNYRMGELQGAVAVAQLEKVDSITSRHHELGENLRSRLEGVPGVNVVSPLPDAECSYKWIIMQVKEDELSVDRKQVVSSLQAEGISCSSYDGYDLIRKRLFQERIVRPWMATREGRMYPFVQPDGRDYTYDIENTPNHKRAMEIGIVVTIDTFYTEADIEEVAAGIWKVLSAYAI